MLTEQILRTYESSLTLISKKIWTPFMRKELSRLLVKFSNSYSSSTQKHHRPQNSIHVALPIEDRERNLTKSILARVCTLNVCGNSTLLRSVQ